MKSPLPSAFALCLVLAPAQVRADLTGGSMNAQWDAGAETCAPVSGRSALQIHAFNAQTFILREKLCATWEAPFMYLLVGDQRALLIDTGDIADPKMMPLHETITSLLPVRAGSKMPLLVVHSHGHLDHREGDSQFENFPDVELVRSDLQHVRSYFGFADWPNGSAQIDLGGRVVDVLPAPGHHPAHVVYYDRNTGILFSGDSLLAGRLLVDDFDAYLASARRLAEFVKDRPVTYVLGGHVEKNRAGELFTWQSSYHPDEHPLQLAKTDVLALPAALQRFNGFYTQAGGFVVLNPTRWLVAGAAAGFAVLAALGILLHRFIRRRRRGRSSKRPS
jgi:hydroxyacylglutathione hydrolase